jgi:hypothetical protein
MVEGIFDYVYYMRRQAFIIPNSYRLNPAFTVTEVIKDLEEVSGKRISEDEFRRLLENNKISTQ